MRITSLAILCVLILSSSIKVSAQEYFTEQNKGLSVETNYFAPKTALTVYPLSMFASSLRFALEVKNKEHSTFKIMPFLGVSDYSNLYVVDGFEEYGLELSYKFYVDKKLNFEGVYASPFISYRLMNFEEDVTGGSVIDKSASNFRLGYLLGYMFRFSEVVCFDIGLGGAYSLSNGDYNNIGDGLGIYSRGVAVHLNAGVGVYLR
jgi:hypothetical protein